MFSCEFCEIPKNNFFFQNTSGGCFCSKLYFNHFYQRYPSCLLFLWKFEWRIIHLKFLLYSQIVGVPLVIPVWLSSKTCTVAAARKPFAWSAEKNKTKQKPKQKTNKHTKKETLKKRVHHFFKANPLSANPIKQENTSKKFVGYCRRIAWVCFTSGDDVKRVKFSWNYILGAICT